MAIGTSEGSTVFIGPVTTAITQSALAALTFVEIGSVESIGEFGPQAQDVSFTPLKGPSVQHLKGAIDNGMLPVVCARDPLDPGQIALAAASGTKFEYAIKVVLNDEADENDTPTTFYFRGPVFSSRNNVGGANDVTKRTFNVGLNVYHEDTGEAVP
ncbi:MAG: iron ABC transporter substrate-binding protein [Brevundimonas sp.]|nr:MAG: iron ABC transporter substrate-binding protein [Brevundimonas sp.]